VTFVDDAVALLSNLSRPRYGKSLYFAGRDLPKPRRERVLTRHGGVHCLRYRGRTGAGCYLHLHGGAFVTRYPQMDDFWARFVVATTGLEAVLPDYDVAPRARYPVAHDQCYDIAARLASESPLVVGGFSGGGNLAASVALRSMAETDFSLRGQLLAVPSVDVAGDIVAKCARAPGAMITSRTLRLVRATYFTNAARRGEPTASPLRARDLRGLPPSFVVTAEHDVLRVEGDAYARRLAGAGVSVQHVVAPGVDHYFLHGAGDTQARSLMEQMARWLTEAMERPAVR
jgi:acetyl esterase